MAGKIGMEVLRELMRRYLEEDGGKRSVEIEAPTLDEALENAAIQLDTTIGRLEYDVIQKGNSGFAGFGKTPWKIRVYETGSKKHIETAKKIEFETDMDFASVAEEVKIVDKDGQVFVRLAPEGALLKVTPPIGKGKRATEKMAFDKLHARAVRQYDENLVKQVVKEASGEWVPVGTFVTNPAADAYLSVDMQPNEMEAYIIIHPPQPGGCDLSKEIMISYLKNNNIIFGIKEDVLQDLENEAVYKTPILVAEGTKPQNGTDASITFFFETDKSKLTIEEKDNRVDYKEMQMVQNVIEGQPLAKKNPPTKGVPGRTITGKYLAAKDGKDIPLPLGKNVRVGDDGLTIIAEVNGEATYTNGKINVETVYIINENIDLKTGNKFFLGTIIVNGNVEDGFSLKATGNIEIKGNVGNSVISAEGDVIIHQGIKGRGTGTVTAGKNIWAKFVENAKLEAGDSVIVTQNIVNSEIKANRKIICIAGKHAAIIGGQYTACEEILAKTVGAPSGGSETILQVGIDPKAKEKIDAHEIRLKQIEKTLEELEKNIKTLTDLKRQKKELSEDKEALLKELQYKRDEITTEEHELRNEYNELVNYLNSLKLKSKISVVGMIYASVRIQIKDVEEEIKHEDKCVTYYLEGGRIKRKKYEEEEDELLKKGPPDAYKTH